MNDAVSYSGTMTLSVFWRAYLRHMGRSWRWFLLFVPILVFSYAQADSLADYVWTVLPFMVGIPAFIVGFTPWLMFRKRPAFQKPISGTVSSAGFTTVSASGKGENDWSQIVKVIDARDFLLLYISSIEFHILPRRFFASEHDWESAKRLALEGRQAATPPPLGTSRLNSTLKSLLFWVVLVVVGVLIYYVATKLEQHGARVTMDPKVYRAEVGEEVIGEFDYVVTEVATQTVLAEGHRVVHLNDVSIEKTLAPSPLTATKHMLLAEPFAFGMFTELHKNVDDVRSFFFQVEHVRGVPTFSFDLFGLDGVGHFTSPDTAEHVSFPRGVAVQVDNQDSLWQVVRTEWLSDHSIAIIRRDRLREFNKAVASGKQKKADWEERADWLVLIKKGGWVNWPSVVAGVVTPWRPKS